MNEFFAKIKAFYEANKTISVGILVVIGLMMFGKRLFRSAPRRRRRTSVKVAYKPRTRTRRRINIKAKKPWQVKGSLAAKRRMAQIRRKKSK